MDWPSTAAPSHASTERSFRPSLPTARLGRALQCASVRSPLFGIMTRAPSRRPPDNSSASFFAGHDHRRWVQLSRCCLSSSSRADPCPIHPHPVHWQLLSHPSSILLPGHPPPCDPHTPLSSPVARNPSSPPSVVACALCPSAHTTRPWTTHHQPAASSQDPGTPAGRCTQTAFSGPLPWHICRPGQVFLHRMPAFLHV
jgi:hypothetical protein